MPTSECHKAGQARLGRELNMVLVLAHICCTLHALRVVANANLVQRHGSAVFTAAISHILAWAMLLSAATVAFWLSREQTQHQSASSWGESHEEPSFPVSVAQVNIWTKLRPVDLIDKATLIRKIGCRSNQPRGVMF